MNKKLLIIGGNGYIGTHLLDYLKINGLSSITTCLYLGKHSNDIKKLDDVIYIKAKYQDMPNEWFADFTDIVLLAGQSSCGNSNNILNVIDNNIRNFAQLLENIGDNQKFIYASSSSVYGNTNNKEANEEYSYYEPYNYYDWSKYTIDQLAILSEKHYYGLRFGTVSGFSRNLRNDIMINSMCYNAKTNGNIYVHNGYMNRPVLGINDLNKAILTIINNGTLDKSGIYNLNSFNSSVSDIANTVADICKVPCKNLENNQDLNFKIQKKSYDIKISSDKFIKAFNFIFEDNIYSITNELLLKWDNIENKQNRLCDNELYKLPKVF
jgi:nucleoside-diphosphate-sugar epimerase